MSLCVISVYYGLSNVLTAIHVLQKCQYWIFWGSVSKHRNPKSETNTFQLVFYPKFFVTVPNFIVGCHYYPNSCTDKITVTTEIFKKDIKVQTLEYDICGPICMPPVRNMC